MDVKQKYIGKMENGLFNLDAKNLKQFFRGKDTLFQSKFQEWIDNSIVEFSKKHPDGYFLLFIEKSKTEINLAYMLDLERYKTQDGSCFIPASHFD